MLDQPFLFSQYQHFNVLLLVGVYKLMGKRSRLRYGTQLVKRGIGPSQVRKYRAMFIFVFQLHYLFLVLIFVTVRGRLHHTMTAYL